MLRSVLLIFLTVFFFGSTAQTASHNITVIKGITLIDGTGALPKNNATLIIQADTIAGVLSGANNQLPANAKIIHLEGKTIIPSLINTHAHLGLMSGTTVASSNYTSDNVKRQLEKYQSFGLGAVLSLGTDHQIIFGLRDSSRQGLLPGATIFSAAYGIGVPDGAPPSATMNTVLRPQTPEESVKAVQQLVPLKPDMIKIWVDDFRGTMPKMKPEIYEAVITEAHKNGLRVSAHVFYLEDARRLVSSGI